MIARTGKSAAWVALSMELPLADVESNLSAAESRIEARRCRALADHPKMMTSVLARPDLPRSAWSGHLPAHLM